MTSLLPRFQTQKREWDPDLDNPVDVRVGAVCKPEGTEPEHTEIMLILTEKKDLKLSILPNTKT